MKKSAESPIKATLKSKYNIKRDCLKKAIAGVVKFTSENPKLKKQLFENDQFPLYLQINVIKVAKRPSRIIRLPLTHSLLTADSEICLIVPDVKGIKNKEHEKHLEHYENVLRQKNVTNIKKVMTFHEFRTEYETFELKSKLVELYDLFLTDGRIGGKVVKNCGKIFYKKRKVPTSVKLQSTNLKHHIEETLKKTSLYWHSKGDSFMVQFGNSKMTMDQLVQNVYCLLEGLSKELPGGFANIRSLNVTTFRGLNVPIYVSLSKYYTYKFGV